MVRQLALVLRRLSRRKLFSTIIILSIGAAISIAILLYAFIQRETRTDQFNTKAGFIYRLLSSDPFTDKAKTISFITKEASYHVGNNYPEIKSVCRVTDLAGDGVVVDHKTDSFEGIMVLAVDQAFYNMFDFPFLETIERPGSDPSEITITEKLAGQIFGRTDVLGEDLIVHCDTAELIFTVAAVMGTISENTHFKFDALVAFPAVDKYLGGSVTYVELDKFGSAENVGRKISSDQQMPSLVGPGKCDYFLQPLPDVYFDKDNVKNFTTARSLDFIRTMWIILFFILIIGAFNFLNLFIISLVDRRKEFAIRKIQGAGITNIRASIVLDIFVYVFIGLSISIVICPLCLPAVNQMFKSELSAAYLFKPLVVGAVVILFASLVVILSFILVFYMNRIQPIGLINDRSMVKTGLSKALFTFQFVIALALILSAVVIVKQVNFIRNKPLGFERQIIELRMPKEGKAVDLHTLKTKLMGHSLFKSVSLSSGNPVSGNQEVRFDLSDKEFYSSYFMAGDERLIETLDLRLKEGVVPTQATGNGKVVNEKFVRYFNITNPIGAPIPGGQGARIIGVVADFNVSSLRKEIPLYMIGYDETPSRLLVNYSGASLDETIPVLRGYWSEVFPNSPFTFSFLGDELLARHAQDLQFSRVTTTFALVSILISCFGLFALALSSCQKKGKEIAIRKSLGASVLNVIGVLIADFGKWVILSFILGSIIGYFGIENWMETFAYRADIDWKVFAITLSVGMFFFLSAIGTQILRAAKANPINGLRYE